MNSEVTMCTVAYNGLYAASLMWESFCKYHDRPTLFVYENGSTDGTAEYLGERADFVWTAEKNDYHGWGLDRLCKKVQTPYTLVVDTDVEFHGRVAPMMMEQDAFAVHDFSDFDSYLRAGKQMEFNGSSYRRMNCFCLWMTMFKTKELQEMLNHYSFTIYTNPERQEMYETSGMIYNVATAGGKKVVSMPLAGKYYTHHRGITNVLFCKTMPELYEATKARYEIIQQRLKDLRNPRPRTMLM